MTLIDIYLKQNKTPKEICIILNIEYNKKNRNGIYERKRKLKNNNII